MFTYITYIFTPTIPNRWFVCLFFVCLFVCLFVFVCFSALPDGCDFEGSDFGPLCGFYQEDETDDFDWTLNFGETPSLDTGPLVDNTFKNETGKPLTLKWSRYF